MAAPQYLVQRLTFFADDDVTPLLGAVDVDGNVVDPSFSTDPKHARPYLEFSEDTGQQSVDFIEGSSTIGTVSLTILDKRRTDDQATGIFTWFQVSGSTGDTAVLRRRAVWEGLLNDGITWVTLMNGVLTRVSLNDDLVSYTIGLRDMRERERRVRLFVKNNDAVADGSGNITVTRGTCVFPLVGPMEGWGRPTKYDDTLGRIVQYGDPQLEPTHGVKGKWVQDLLNGSYVFFDINDPASGLVYAEGREELFAKYGQSSYDGQGQILLATGIFENSYLNYDKYFYKNVIAQWSPNPTGGPWYTMHIMPANTGIVPFRDNLFEVVEGQSSQSYNFGLIKGTIPEGTPFKYVRSAKLIPSAGDTAPANGQTVYVRYISNMQPEKDVPKYLEEETFGIFLKKIYDGEFSDPEVPPRIKYDTAAMDKMITDTPLMIGMVSEVVTDMRGWVEENIYKPLGYAPALSPDGTITPIKYALPDETVPLLMLTDANVEKATWEHSDSNVINKVTFTYQRDMVPAVPSLNTIAGVKINTVDVIIENWNIVSIPLFDTKSLDYKPATTHSVLVTGSKFAPRPNVSSEVGWRLAMARTADVIMRFGNGAQTCVVTAMASDPDVVLAKIGGWAVLAVSWLPDYKTRIRGISRLMQITDIKRVSPITYEFTLIDAGPFADAKTCPTVSNIQQYADGRVSVDVTAIPADTVARLEYAIGDTEPPTDSGAWLLLKRTETVETVYTTQQAPGITVWIRWRGEAQGARPSSWCGTLNITVADSAQMVDARLILIDGVPRVSWVGTSSTLGIRVYYQRHPEGSAQPTVLGSSVDEDVNENGSGGRGYADLPFKLDPYEQITVQVVGYPGFAGGAVTGTAGMASQFMTAQYIVDVGAPTILPIVSYSGGGLVGAATLTVNEDLPTDTIGVQVKDDANTIWTLVTSGADSTPLLVAPGTVIASTSWFYNGTDFEQVLMGQGLTSGVTRTFYAQASATKTGLKSDWIPFTWQGVETGGTSEVVMAEDDLVNFPAGRRLEDSVDGALTFSRATANKIIPTVDGSVIDIGDNITITNITNILDDLGTGSPIIQALIQVATTLSLDPGATEFINMPMAKSIALQIIETDYPAWVRMYATSAMRGADSARVFGDDPVFESSGEPIAEAAPGVASFPLKTHFKRNIVCHNQDNPRVGRFYLAVTNKDTVARAITVYITYLPLEGDPATIGPLPSGQLWYDYSALNIVGKANNEAFVSNEPWPNTVPLVGDALAQLGGGSPPLYKTADMNGRPAVRIAGDGWFQMPAQPGTAFQAADFFCVWKVDPAGSSSAWDLGACSFPGGWPATPGSGTFDDCTFGVQTGSTSTGGVNVSVPFIHHVHVEPDIFEVRFNNTLVYSNYTLGAFNINLHTRWIGAFNQGGFFRVESNSWFGRMMIWTRALTPTEQTDARENLADEWGIVL